MIYTEFDLNKVHNLTKKGLNFQEIKNALRLEKVKACGGEKIEILIDAICEHYNVTREQLRHKTRLGHIVEARRMYCYLSRAFTPKSFKFIGGKINRDHATVLHQVNNISGYVEIKDTGIISDIDDITREYQKNVKLFEDNLKHKQNV